MVCISVLTRPLKFGLVLSVRISGCLLVSLVVKGRTRVWTGMISMLGRLFVVIWLTIVTWWLMALVAGSRCLRGSALYVGKTVVL